MTRLRLVLTAVAVTTASLAAQSERMTIRLSPTPNQTTQLRAAQDMIMMTEAEAPAGGALGLGGQTRDTLTSVTFDGADRIAHLAVHASSTITPAADTNTAMALDLTATGDGNTDVNVDRGLVLHAERHSILETSVRPPSTAAAAVSVRMHGTFNRVTDLVK